MYEIEIRTPECTRIYLHIDGIEAAWDAYRHAEALAELAELEVCLIDEQTGEVLADNDEDLTDADCEDYGPTDLDEGFDPYEGCYTYDC